MDTRVKNGNNSIDMVNGPLLKNIVMFAIPLMFSSFLQILFNAADTVVVGKFAGEQALAAVGANGSLIFLMTALFNGLALGSNVIVARSIGANDDEQIRKSVSTSVSVSLICSVFLTLIGIIFAPQLLRLMNTPEDFIEYSVLYMRIYFTGTVFMLFYNFGSAVLRSKGDTKRPLYYLIIAGIVNVGLNLFMVIVLEMGVAGVAIATVVSQALSAALTAWALIRDDDATHLDFRRLSINKKALLELMRIGIPAGLQGVVYAISNVVIQSSINSFDSTVIVAGNAAGGNLESFVYIGCGAFSSAAVTFISQNFGAKRLDRILKIFGLTTVLTILVSGVLSLIVYLNGPALLGFYTESPRVVMVGMKRVAGVALWLFINGILDVIVSALRGMGSSFVPTVIMMVGICGFRLIWIWTVFPVRHTLESIYACFPISWTICIAVEIVLFVIVYRRVVLKGRTNAY